VRRLCSQVDRRASLVEALLGGEPGPDPAALPLRVCELCVLRLSLSAASIALMGGPHSREVLACAGRLGALVEQAQFAAGEGPGLEAFTDGVPALEPDLAGSGVARWPGFARDALALGVRAVFAVPLRIGSALVGALDLASDSPGPLSTDAYADLLVLAEVTTNMVLMLQAGAPNGMLAAALAQAGSDRIVVHQATGMVSAQLRVPVADALARLRGYAITSGRALDQIAADVVARRLRLED
jgi:ANTAR domain